MKISAHLEFDTFAEAEKVFRHLGMLDDKTIKVDVPSAKTHPHVVEVAKQHAAAEVKEDVAAKETIVPKVTLDDLKQTMREYIAKANGRTAGTGREIMLAHGVMFNGQPSGNPNHAQPEQYVALMQAFKAATQDREDEKKGRAV